MKLKPWHWLAAGAGVFILFKNEIAQTVDLPFIKLDVTTPGKTVLLNKVNAQYELSGTVNPITPKKSFMGKTPNGNTMVAAILGDRFQVIIKIDKASETFRIGDMFGDDDPILRITRIREL